MHQWNGEIFHYHRISIISVGEELVDLQTVDSADPLMQMSWELVIGWLIDYRAAISHWDLRSFVSTGHRCCSGDENVPNISWIFPFGAKTPQKNFACGAKTYLIQNLPNFFGMRKPSSSPDANEEIRFIRPYNAQCHEQLQHSFWFGIKSSLCIECRRRSFVPQISLRPF